MAILRTQLWPTTVYLYPVSVLHVSVYIYRSNVSTPAGFEHDPSPVGVFRWQWGGLPGPEAATEDRSVSAITQRGHQSPHHAHPQVRQVQGQCTCEAGVWVLNVQGKLLPLGMSPFVNVCPNFQST